MFVAFLIFTICPTTEESVDEMKGTVMRNVCYNRSEILMSVGALIAALVIYKLITSKSRRNLKEKFKQK